MAISVLGATFPPKPDPKNFYVDEAGLLTESAAQSINKIAGTLWQEERVPIIVVTINSLQAHDAVGHTIESYAHELFNHWGIGSERRNYGILLLISIGDRKARIELGAAWGSTYNYKAQEVMNNLIVPNFKRGEFSEGIVAGVNGLDAMARGLNLPKPKPPWGAILLYVALSALVVGVIISLFKSGRNGWGWALIVAVVVILFFLLRAMAQSGGSRGAFGGGFSGGGGASGSW